MVVSPSKGTRAPSSPDPFTTPVAADVGDPETPVSTGKSPGSGGSQRGTNRGPAQTVARNCVVDGDGLVTAMTRTLTAFTIEARNAEGTKQSSGGDRFKVEVRGTSVAHAKVMDLENGEYKVEYKPSTSGVYYVSITLNGVPLPNSPFRVEVLTPAPDPLKCVLSGAALTKARARETATFEVEFVDAHGQIARAEEIDVWVEKFEKADEGGVELGGGGGGGGASASALTEHAYALPHKDGEDGENGDSARRRRPSSEEMTSPGGGTAGGDASASPQKPATPSRQPSKEAVAATATGGADGGGAQHQPLSKATYRQLMTSEALKQTGGRVEVGSKPLIMRAESGLESALVSILRPGQLVTVLEEIDVDDGSVRARVETVAEEPAARAIADSWYQPPQSTYGMYIAADHQLAPLSARLSARGGGGGGGGGDGASAHSITYNPSSPPGSGASPHRSDLPTPGAIEQASAKLAPSPGRPWWMPEVDPSAAQRSGGGGGMLSAVSGMGSTARSSGVDKAKAKQALGGWVTLYKEGAELVAPRPRLHAGERRRNMELWARREATDRAQKKLLDGGAGGQKHHATAEEKVGPSMAQELSKDPLGIAFAYGGINPVSRSSHARLHAPLQFSSRTAAHFAHAS